MALPSFAGGGTFSAPGGLSVQIPEGNFKNQIQTLSQQPGMGYLNDLVVRADVNWQAVKLANDQWNYSQSGKIGGKSGSDSNLLSTCVQTGPNQLSLTLTEGKHHQVKRMIAAVGNRVEGEGGVGAPLADWPA